MGKMLRQYKLKNVETKDYSEAFLPSPYTIPSEAKNLLRTYGFIDKCDVRIAIEDACKAKNCIKKNELYGVKKI